MTAHRYEATVEWRPAGAAFATRRYARAHRWRFDGGAEVPASASPRHVPVPLSDPAGVDPEEALVAALASCHMLFFLDLASRDGLDVAAYRDRAVGELGRRADGREAMVRVTLRPAVEWGGADPAARAGTLHERAHHLCYLANSVNFPVVVEPLP